MPSHNYSYTVPGTGLYFSVSGTVYQPGDSVLITDSGAVTGPSLEGAANSLVCHTDNVNTRCCRGSDNPDGGRVPAEWLFPDGGTVPGNTGNSGLDFTRSGFTQQLRLNRRNNALTPTGGFTCRVPDGVDSAVTHSEVITLIVGE